MRNTAKYYAVGSILIGASSDYRFGSVTRFLCDHSVVVREVFFARKFSVYYIDIWVITDYLAFIHCGYFNVFLKHIMKKKSITIKLENGLEARPIAMLVQVASRYESSIYIETGDKKVNAKSIMGMMTLILSAGDTITVSADGKDEDEALEGIDEYLSGK